MYNDNNMINIAVISTEEHKKGLYELLLQFRNETSGKQLLSKNKKNKLYCILDTSNTYFKGVIRSKK